MGYDPQLSKYNVKTYSGLPFTYEVRKGRMVNIQKNFGLTAGKKVKSGLEFGEDGIS